MPSLIGRKAFGSGIFNPSVAAPVYETPSYLNAGGSGNRPGITVTGKDATLWGAIYTENRFVHWVDGEHPDPAGGEILNAVPVAGEWVSFDFGELKLITEMKMYWTTNATPTGVWRCQGWDGSDWVNVGDTFTMGTALTQTIDLSGNTTGYTKYRWLGVSGNSDFNCYYWSEVEFKIGSLVGGGGGAGLFYFGAFGSSLVAGDEALKLRNKILVMNPDYSMNYTMQAVSGNWPWSNLVRLGAGILAMNDAHLIMCDNRSVNPDREQRALEATYRKIRAAHTNVAIVAAIYPGTLDPETDIVSDLTAQELADQTLAAAYGVHLVDYRQEVIDRVALGEPLTNYIDIGEQVHPSETGKNLLVNMIYAAAVNGDWLNGEAEAPAIPDPTYDTDLYFTNTTPTRKLGTANDGTAGTWTTTGTRIESSETGATVTWVQTCRSFGLYSAGTSNSVCDVQIDGGAWQENIVVTENGYYGDLLETAEHTIVVRVRAGAAIRIDEFWAV